MDIKATFPTIVYTGSFQSQFKTSLTADADIDGTGDGIYVYRLDEESGELLPHQNVPSVINPARLFVDQSGRRLYAASDTNEFLNWEAGTGGGVYAFEIRQDGRLKEVGRRSSCGVRAVDLCCDSSGKYLIVINEGSNFCTTEFIKGEDGRFQPHVRWDEGCAVLFRLSQDGFEKVCDRYVLPEGTPAHPCSVKIGNGNIVYITNASAGVVSLLKLDTDAEKLIPVVAVQPEKVRGLGNVVLHPVLPVFYCACEESGEIIACRFDDTTASIQLIQRMTQEEKCHPGPVSISPNGNTLYAADSSREEVRVYSISQEGKLVLLQQVAIGSSCKNAGFIYDIATSPSGKWVMLSDIKQNRILLFPIMKDGRLSTDRKVVEAKTPTGIQFLKG